MRRPELIRITRSRMPMRTLNRKVLGSGLGTGVGTVLLDGGMGGQSTYHSIEDYERTTGRNLAKSDLSGKGLADRIGERLSKINIDTTKPKKKNITMNF
jgi:hypothetical protein